MLLCLHHIEKSNPDQSVIDAAQRFASLERYKEFDYACRIAPDGCVLIVPYDLVKNKPTWGRSFLNGQIAREGTTEAVRCSVLKGFHTCILFSPKNY